ncbi:MAG: DUF3368 domain-containing protein [Armatimonadetes bacterium]|nr:DUF3368 domain-containing protein [Armatimonadota bacterium]
MNLAIVGELELLPRVLGDIVVPGAVRDELELGSALPGAAELRAAFLSGWLHVETVRTSARLRALRGRVDPGEAESIALALQLRLPEVVIDDLDGRRVAQDLGLDPIGLLRVLLVAKRDGLLPSVEPVLDRLDQQARFYVSAQLREHVLREAGEL